MKRGAKIAIGVCIVAFIGWVIWPKPNPKPKKSEAPPTSAREEVKKLAFLPAKLLVKRRYDQRGAVSLCNGGSQPVDVMVRARSAGDLLAGFVGRGSDEGYEPRPVTIQPGETWTFSFVVHAHAAREAQYRVPVEAVVGKAVVATSEVEVDLEPATFSVKADWREATESQDQARLVRILRLANSGDAIPEFTMVVPEGLEISPVIEKAFFEKGAAMEVRVWPRLYEGFAGFEGTIRIEGLGADENIPCSFKLPEGKGVFLALSRCSRCTRNTGRR